MFRKSARGLFDLLMASMAIWTLLERTPTGELVLRGGHQVRCLIGKRCAPTKETDLLSFFGNPDKPGVQDFSAPEPSSLVSRIAEASGASAPVLNGFVRVSTSNLESPDLLLDSLSPAGKDLLQARGASAADLATAEGRLHAAGQAIADLTRELGSPDAALTALVIGLSPAQYAVERARAERGALTLDALAPHISPGLRATANQIVEPALKFATVYDLAWPVPRNTRIASRYGWRVDPINGSRSLHNGVDLSVASGTPISATGDGQVRRAGEDSLNGKFLVIDHGHGVTTGFCHNSELLVARGDAITRSMVITHSGNTGRSTGPHLHYTVAIAGVAYDPLEFLTGSERAAMAAAVPPPPPAAPAKPAAPVPVAATGLSPALARAYAAAAAPSAEPMGSDAPGIEEPRSAAPPLAGPDAPAAAAVELPPDAGAEVPAAAPAPVEPDAGGP